MQQAGGKRVQTVQRWVRTSVRTHPAHTLTLSRLQATHRYQERIGARSDTAGSPTEELQSR